MYSYILVVSCITATAHARDPVGFVDTNAVTQEFTYGRWSNNAVGFKIPYFWMIKFRDVFYILEGQKDGSKL
jgi:hypothetical protein